MLGKSALSSDGSGQAAFARVNAKKNESPCVSTSRPLAISHRIAQDPAVDIEDLAVPVAELLREAGSSPRCP